METKFKIGESVYLATFGMKNNRVQCPDCFGKKFLTIIMGDDSQVQIECGGCSAGYEPPRGTVVNYEHLPKVELCDVVGIEISSAICEYKISRCSESDKGEIFFHTGHVKENEIFSTKEEAQAKADQMAKEFAIEEERRLKCVKQNAKRTWSWNVCYHRGIIRRAEKDIAYHSQKLAYAKPKIKEEKQAAV